MIQRLILILMVFAVPVICQAQANASDTLDWNATISYVQDTLAGYQQDSDTSGFDLTKTQGAALITGGTLDANFTSTATTGMTVEAFGIASNWSGDTSPGDWIQGTVANTDFKMAFEVPTQTDGQTVIVDSIFVVIDTDTDAAYITQVLLQTYDWDGTGTTRMTYSDDIGNGDQTLHTVNILASDYVMLPGYLYWILLTPAAEIGAGECNVHGYIVYYHRLTP